MQRQDIELKEDYFNEIKEYDINLLALVRNPIDRVKSDFNLIKRVSTLREINWYRINIKNFVSPITLKENYSMILIILWYAGFLT